MRYILTCDVGTTGIKCALVDRQGRIAASGTHPLRTEYPHDGWAQQDTAQYLPSAAAAIRRCMEESGAQPPDIAAIGLSGTMNGIIPVDDAGVALYPNITHQDTRSHAQAAQIEREISLADFYRRTGNRIDVHSSLPKAAWFRGAHPDLYAKTRFFLNTKDYMHGCLTGLFDSTDLSDASLTASLNIARKDWDDDIARVGGMAGKLPYIRPSMDVSRRLTREAAALLGLHAGTPVAIGAGDGACASRGAGVYAVGQGYACLGSSGWISVLADRQIIDMRMFSYYDIGGELLNFCGTVQSVTAALDFMLETVLGLPLTAEGFRLAEALALASPPGANGLVFTPTLMGERTPLWDPAARGSLSNMSLSHTRADIVRAVYEGIADALNTCLLIARENNAAPEALKLIGGGARSKVWPGMMQQIFGIPVSVSQNPGEATALGAAFTAGAGCGFWETLEETAALVR